jgi:hypothetical protein
MPNWIKEAGTGGSAWSHNLDWRISAILLAMAVAVLITALCFWFGIGQDPATLAGAIFAAWAGGVALFIVVGLVVGLVSLVRPEKESFDARARILFRRETGAHIDYIVRRIKDILEHYAESTEIYVIIKDYDSNDNKYRVQTSTKVIVRSYLDDIDTSYKSFVASEDVTSPPAGGLPNRLVFLKVAGTPIGGSEDFTSAIRRDVETTIEKDGSCLVEYMTEMWISADTEPSTHSPRRYTQAISLEIQNLCQNGSNVKVALTSGGLNRTTVELAYGESRTVLKAANIQPGVDAYDYRVLAP